MFLLHRFYSSVGDRLSGLHISYFVWHAYFIVHCVCALCTVVQKRATAEVSVNRIKS